MKDGKNHHARRFGDEKDSIWEPPQQNPSNVTMNNLVMKRVPMHLHHCRIELRDELPSEIVKLLVVPVTRL
jgi:hypothetical protein